MKIMRNVLWWTFACLALSACAKTTSSGGSSETHFLALCNASCEDGFSCLCGVCTESCDGDDACEALNGEASCQVSEDGCGTPKVCDVGCSDDEDCAALGARHACEAGHCRAPNEEMMMSGGAGGMGGSGGGGGSGDGGMQGDLPECTVDAVAEYLIGSEAFVECTEDDTLSSTARAQCVRELFDEEEPFVVSWYEQGVDSILMNGFAGVMGPSGYVVYGLDYDSFGSVSEHNPIEPWITSWSKCTTFAINQACDAIDECFVCEEDDTQACGCGSPSAPLQIVCGGTDITPPGECDAPACAIDGICYPDGESTEDGCCSCEDGGYTCIEPGWCPGWPNISKRCESDDDCGPGLQCSGELASGNNVCTRTCNFGCPTGYGCVAGAEVRDEPLDSICLKECESNGDCEVGGVALESLCTVVDPDTNQAYCL